MSRDYLYKRISKDLLEKIKDGHYKEGDFLEHAETLTSYYDTSIITINKALSILVSQGYVKRIPGKGTQVLNFRKKNYGKGKKQSKLIGAIVYDISYSNIWSPTLKAIEHELFPNGYQLIVGNDRGNVERALEYIDRFSSQKVDGIIFVPISFPDKASYLSNNGEILQALDDSGIPYVLMHRLLPHSGSTQISFDNYYDTTALAESLFTKGYRKPLFLSYSCYNSVIDERERGFRDALLQKGIEHPDGCIFRQLPDHIDYESSGTDLAGIFREIIDENLDIDSIVTISSYYLNILYNMQYSDPILLNRNISFSGFGDIKDFFHKRNISHLQKNSAQRLGEATIKALISIIEGNQNFQNIIIRIPSELYVHQGSK